MSAGKRPITSNNKELTFTNPELIEKVTPDAKKAASRTIKEETTELALAPQLKKAVTQFGSRSIHSSELPLQVRRAAAHREEGLVNLSRRTRSVHSRARTC